MNSPKSRNSCSFLNVLLTFLSFILLLFSAASLAPIIALKMPPSSLGFAFLTISCLSLLSSLTGFFSQLSRFCYITHVSLLLTSSACQLIGIVALYVKEKSSISMFKSPRDPREAMLLVRLECGLLVAMFVMQLGVLVLTCSMRRCWVRELEDFEAEREVTEMKRRQRVARVHEEAMAEASRIAVKNGTGIDTNV